MLGVNGFVFAANTFAVGQPVQYSIGMQDGTALPDWLSFDSNLRKISGTPPQSQMQLSLRVIAQGPEARATDGFVLQLDEAKRAGPKPSDRRPPPVFAPPKSTTKPVNVAKPKVKAPSGQAARFVQAKALSSRAAAQKFADRVGSSTGLEAFVRKTKRRNPPLYRVIIPPSRVRISSR